MFVYLFVAVPEQPTNLQVSEVTWESVALQWDAGFDGGYAQAFLVAYTDQTRVWRTNVGPVTQYNVTHLFPDVTYTFQVVGENELGRGRDSEPVAAQTSCT